jgi:hypothetical protein
MNTVPRGAHSVMAQRLLPPDAIEFFATPPWATRALFEHVLPHIGVDPRTIQTAWDPMCGQGHMTGVMEEYIPGVTRSDIFDYGIGASVIDYFDTMYGDNNVRTQWTIMNPPFRPALEAVLRALTLSEFGVCVLLRTAWIEGGDRYKRLFRDNPPTLFVPFVERVPMVEGRWDPDATTATSYSWFIFAKGMRPMAPFWIPPGCAKSLTKPDDRRRYAPWLAFEDDPAAIEVVARQLCAFDAVDPDIYGRYDARDCLTYRERKAGANKGIVEMSNWRGRRRRADDILAMRLMAEAA